MTLDEATTYLRQTLKNAQPTWHCREAVTTLLDAVDVFQKPLTERHHWRTVPGKWSETTISHKRCPRCRIEKRTRERKNKSMPSMPGVYFDEWRLPDGRWFRESREHPRPKCVGEKSVADVCAHRD